jgi:hypothetical protein
MLVSIEMFNVSEILYGTLDTFSKVYGLKIVIKVCQQFIIDSIKEEEEKITTLATPSK